MTYSQSIKNVFSNYSTFEGRASRSEYWWFFLFNLVMLIALGELGRSMNLEKIPNLDNMNSLQVVYYFVSFIPHLSVGVRRMHDIDRQGWWVLVPFYSIYLLILRGTHGKNKFGKEPKS